eukprot:1159406-Pelagomonas_calceolata.AAC.11
MDSQTQAFHHPSPILDKRTAQIEPNVDDDASQQAQHNPYVVNCRDAFTTCAFKEQGGQHWKAKQNTRLRYALSGIIRRQGTGRIRKGSSSQHQGLRGKHTGEGNKTLPALSNCMTLERRTGSSPANSAEGPAQQGDC